MISNSYSFWGPKLHYLWYTRYGRFLMVTPKMCNMSICELHYRSAFLYFIYLFERSYQSPIYVLARYNVMLRPKWRRTICRIQKRHRSTSKIFNKIKNNWTPKSVKHLLWNKLRVNITVPYNSVGKTGLINPLIKQNHIIKWF